MTQSAPAVTGALPVSVATDTLDSLAATGQLEVCPLSAWRRIAAACYNGNMKRCLSVEMACAEISEKADAGNETCPWRRRRKWCKEYATAELMFREGFPDHLNCSYPLGGQPETVQPEMQNLYAIIKTQ